LVISVAMPILNQKERGMLSETEKVIIGRFAHVSEAAFIGAREKGGADGSRPFPGVGDPERFIPVFEPLPLGDTDGRGVSEPDRIDPAIKRDGLEPARLDGQGDEIAAATNHLLAGVEHDAEGTGGVCKGEGCKIDHIEEARRLLHKHMSLREALPNSNGLVRFQR
jgi:hypothetical protein